MHEYFSESLLTKHIGLVFISGNMQTFIAWDHISTSIMHMKGTWTSLLIPARLYFEHPQAMFSILIQTRCIPKNVFMESEPSFILHHSRNLIHFFFAFLHPETPASCYYAHVFEALSYSKCIFQLESRTNGNATSRRREVSRHMINRRKIQMVFILDRPQAC